MRRAEFWDVSVWNRVKQIERDIEENETEKTGDFLVSEVGETDSRTFRI